MAEPEAVDVPSTTRRRSVSAVRIAVSMRRSEDAPSEEIELLADELIEDDPSPPAALLARIRSRIPALPRWFRRRLNLPLVAAAPSTATPPASELAELRLDIDRLLSRMRDRDAYLDELERIYQQRSAELLEADRREADLTSRVHRQALHIAELERQLQDRNLRILQLQAACSLALPAHALQPPAAGSGKDELLRIRGIGPSYAQALRTLGVDSLAAIAAWSPCDVSAIAKRLNIKTRRIQRDRWIEQARALLQVGQEPAPDSGPIARSP